MRGCDSTRGLDVGKISKAAGNSRVQTSEAAGKSAHLGAYHGANRIHISVGGERLLEYSDSSTSFSVKSIELIGSFERKLIVSETIVVGVAWIRRVVVGIARIRDEVVGRRVSSVARTFR